MRIHTVLTLSLLFSMFLPLSVAADETDKSFDSQYKQWSQLSSEELLNRSDYYYNQANLPDSALLCYSIVANRFYTTNKRDTLQLHQSATAMNQLAILYQLYYYDYQKAHQYLLMAQDIAQENGFRRTLVSVYINLANLYLLQNSMDDCPPDSTTITLHRKAFLAALEIKNWYAVIPATFNYAVLGDDEERGIGIVADLQAFFRADMPDSIIGKRFVAEFCQGIKSTSQQLNDQALALFDSAYVHVSDRNPVTEDIYRMNIIDAKARLLIRMHREDEANRLIHSLIDKAREGGNHSILYVCYLALQGYNEEIGHADTAREYELLALREKDIVMNQNKLIEAGKAEFVFQINKKNEEVKVLSYERRIQRLIICGAVAFTLLIICVLFMLYRRYRQTMVNNRQLYQKNLELLAADEERRKLLLEYEERLQAIPEKGTSVQKYQTHQVDEQEQEDLLHRILYIMETSPEVYTDTFSLKRLSELVDVPQSNYVSQVINDHYGRTFPTLLNEYRIREACRRMNDRQHFGNLTNEAVAQSVGYSSYPNFVSNFKKFTGLTPSAYQKQVKG